MTRSERPAWGFEVVTWNVLADAYARPAFFPDSPPDCLAPGARMSAVLATIEQCAAPVTLLQEVEPALVEGLVSHFPGGDVRWCPKEGGRPDGCAALVLPPWRVQRSDRLVYADGQPASGHVAQLLELRGPGGAELLVANTHLRYAAREAVPHVGVRQASELVGALAAEPVVLFAGDTNDAPGGPVRRVLTDAGFVGAESAAATSLFGGGEPRALDLVAGRGVRITSRAARALEAPLPGPRCPSDHVPLRAWVEKSATRLPAPPQR